MSKKLNNNAVKIRIKSEEGEVLFKESANSILFASVLDSRESSFQIEAGKAGTFNLKSIIRSLEAVTIVTAKAVKEHHNISAEDFIKLMSKVTSSAVSEVFSSEDETDAVLDALMELLKNRIH